MNIRILAASALAILAPAANAATVHHNARSEHRNVRFENARNSASSDDKCAGNLNLGTFDCKVSGVSSKYVKLPRVTKTSSAYHFVGHKAKKIVLITNADRGSNSHPSQV